MKLEKVCDSESPESAVGTFLCSLDAGHDGLHTWHSPAGKGSPDRLWTDDGIDFIGPPYTPDAPICNDMWNDEDGSHIACVRPKGHTYQHGNYHDEQYPAMWTGLEEKDVPSTYGTLTELAKTPEGAHHPARFEIVIDGGNLAVAKKVRLNGLEIPNLHDLSIEYGPFTARTVVLEILATDIIEVPA